MAVTLYGIPNCDTVRKARKWLEAEQVDYHFHDFRKDGLEPSLLQQWINQLGWEVLVNKRGLTWRKLSPEQKADLDQASAVQLMLDEPALIKRPVLDLGGQYTVGFSADKYAKLFS